MTPKNHTSDEETGSEEELDGIEESEEDEEVTVVRNYTSKDSDYKSKLRSNHSSPYPSAEVRNRQKTSSAPNVSKRDQESMRPQKVSQNQRSSSSFPLLVIGIIAFLFSIVVMFQLYPTTGQDVNKCSTSLIFNDKSDICKKQGQLCSVVSKAFARSDLEKPIMFVLLANRDDVNVAKCVSEAIASFGSCMMNTTGSLIITPQGFSYNTDVIITKFTPMFEEYRSVVFENLLDMDVPSLKAMHNFCDVYNPIVKPAVYTIIVITDVRIDYADNQSWTRIVKNLLKKKFENINEDKIEPLITRITDGPILPVFPGKSAICHNPSDNFKVV